MYLFLESAAGTAAAGSSASMILMFVVLIAVFYFFMIRPENKRKKQADEMRNALKVGDNITTIGGVIGDIVSIKDNSIVIETSADRVRVEFAKFAVALALGKLMDKYGFSIRKTKDIGIAIALILIPMLLIIAQKETGSALVYCAFFLMLYREGMTGSLLFSGFACVLYFVVGMKFSEDYIVNMPVSIGEFTVLLLAMIFTVGMVWVYCRNLTAVKIISCICFGGTLIGMLFSIFVIPFDVCYIMLGLCVLMIGYIIGVALFDMDLSPFSPSSQPPFSTLPTRYLNTLTTTSVCALKFC